MREVLLLSGLLLLCSSFSAVRAESLYSPSTFKPLIVDNRAYRVGDALTVLVQENTSAFSSADTELQRQQGIAGGITTDSKDFAGGLEFGTNSSGAGTTSRSSRLQTQLTVTVVEVMQNGDLLVSGTKNIEVNREAQVFQIAGRVRREDIAPDNTVQSNRLADVKVNFSGNGDISDRQKPGLISRVFEWLGLP